MTDPAAGDGGVFPERHATWLELFFDLVTAAAVAKLATGLLKHPGAAGLGGYLLLFVPVWWNWLNFSYLASQFDRGTRHLQMIMLGAMFGSLLLAASVGEGLRGHSVALPLSYAALRALLVGVYVWRAAAHVEERSLCLRYAVGFTAGIALWLATLALPVGARWPVWVVALLVEISTPVLAHLTAERVPEHVSHMPERFGLFTLIVLGETVLGVTGAAGGPAPAPGSIPVPAAGFALAAVLWWCYFHREESTVITQALSGSRRDLFRSYVFGYAHLGIFAALPIAGVGVIRALEGDAGAVSFVLLGTAGFVVSDVVAKRATPRSLPRRLAAGRLLTAAGLVGVAAAIAHGGWRVPAAPAIGATAAVVWAAYRLGDREDATVGQEIGAVRWRRPGEQ